MSAGFRVCDGIVTSEHPSHASGYYTDDQSRRRLAAVLHPDMIATANNQVNICVAGGVRIFTSCCDYSRGRARQACGSQPAAVRG